VFLHALKTGLADETIRAKVRPLTQNPQVADEDLMEVMSLATSAETERSINLVLQEKQIFKDLWRIAWGSSATRCVFLTWMIFWTH